MLRAAGRLIRADLRAAAVPGGADRARDRDRRRRAAGHAAPARGDGGAVRRPHARDERRAPGRRWARPTAVAEAAALPEVAEAGAPRRLVRVAAAARRRPAHRLRAAGARDGRPPAGDRGPAPARGRASWRSTAALALGMGLGPGDRMSLGGERLEVVGVAVLAAPERRRLGHARPGDRAHARAAAGGRARRAGVVVAAGAAAARPGRRRGGRPAARRAGEPGRRRLARGARSDFTDESRRTLAILGASTLLALLATGFTLATAIGGRVLADRRRIGLLRSVGVTPARRHRRARRPLPDRRACSRRRSACSAAGCSRRRCSATRSSLLGTPQPGPPGPARSRRSSLAARAGRRGARRARCRPGGRAACRRSSRSSRSAPATQRASRAARAGARRCGCR